MIMKRLCLLLAVVMLCACSSGGDDIPPGGKGGEITEIPTEKGPLVDENGTQLVTLDNIIMNSYTIMVGSLESDEYEVVEDENGNINHVYEFKLAASYAGEAVGNVQLSIPYSTFVDLDTDIVPDKDMHIASMEETDTGNRYEIINPLYKGLAIDVEYMVFVKNETSEPYELGDNVSIFEMLDGALQLWVNDDMEFTTDYSDWQAEQLELEEVEAYTQDQVDTIKDDISGKKIGDVITRFSEILR